MPRYTEPEKPTWEPVEHVVPDEWVHIVPSEWLRIDNDDEKGIYITALSALNLPTGPLGDWHDMCWRPPADSKRSTRTDASERCCRLGMRLWDRDELIDARRALRAIGHPEGNRETPIWAASHVRAVAEMAVDSLITYGYVNNPDIRSTRRWLTREQRETCARMLKRTPQTIGASTHLNAWARALCESKPMPHDE